MESLYDKTRKCSLKLKNASLNYENYFYIMDNLADIRKDKSDYV